LDNIRNNLLRFSGRREMRRRVGLTDFKVLPAVAFETRALGTWEKCDRYEIREGEIVARPNRVRGLTGKYEEEWISYNPIDDVPDLFLRFARLYEESDFDRAALDFTSKYGLPNGADEAPAPFGDPGFETEAINWSLSQFHHEARRAWVVLALYEAVLNDEERTVRRLLSDHSDIDVFEGWLPWLPIGSAEHQNDTLWVGLRCAQEAAEMIVHQYCRQQIVAYLDPDIRPSVPHDTDIVWTFDNLLGAMYLQMYWLMTSSDSIARCEHCSLPISLGRPHRDGRKRRSDKRFCRDACRQAHHRSKRRSADSPS
jgi:hypothetical protein